MTNSVVKLTLPGGRGYDIRIGAGVNASLGESMAALTPHRSVALIADSNVAPLYDKKSQENYSHRCQV